MGKAAETLTEAKNLLDAVLVSKAADNGSIEGFASYKSVDRYGDLVLPSAFNATIPKFLKNPIFCLGHDSSGNGGEAGLPIGSVRSMEVTQEGVKFSADFGSHNLAQVARKLFQEGHLRAFSIGFWIRGQRDPTEDESKDYGPKLRRVVTELELAEISAVPLPACREALMISIKGMTATGEDRLQVRKFMETMTGILSREIAPPTAESPWQKAVTAAYKDAAESFGQLGSKATALETAGDDKARTMSLKEVQSEIKGLEGKLEALKTTAGAWGAALAASSDSEGKNSAAWNLDGGQDIVSALRKVGAAG